VHIPGITANPDGAWTAQQIRSLLMDPDDRAAGFRLLIRDRAGQFTASSGVVLAGAGAEATKIPPRSPRANCHAERFVLTVRTEVTDRMLILGQRHLRTIPAGFEAQYNGGGHIAAASSGRPGPATLSPAFPRSRSSDGLSSAVSSTSTSEPHKSQGQGRSPSSGTPHPQIVNYGETGADIGDVGVTPGSAYYVVWYQPPTFNGSTWVTYLWAGGSTISTSDLMQAAVRGYNR